MAPEARRPLKVFLCHASGDKPAVRDLYKRLTMEGVDAWLDKEKLLPGQDWQAEIPRAVHESDVVVVCLSNKSITKEGYVQKEIRFALDIAEEKPDGSIFLIPARLEDCPVPERLSRWQWVDLYEENGFIQLLRSLKLRAGTVGAVIETISYEDTDREREKKLNQLYTEGLEAFYTEDWDRACRRFQAILSEQSNHRRAAEKLEEAQCQGHYVKLYTQAVEACRSENWTAAIPVLEELTQKAPNYKDAAQLLRDARKREQLAELYEEAKALHAAQKWQAVVRVFEQISILEPNYPDAEGLLASAQKEVAEFKRLADLNEQYSQGLRAMESGNWHEARRLLENVHKSQMGFLETEKLLRKVENAISKEEEKRKQNEQIEISYEQAHGLIRSRKWRNALKKLEEIRMLDEQFPDTEGIAERAQKELDREEAEAERQNRLAALYAESVRLLKEEKYQEALDKWQEVRALDPKYPDRQGVQKIMKRKLAGKDNGWKRQVKLPGIQSKYLPVISISILVVLGLAGGIIYLNLPPILPHNFYIAGYEDPVLISSTTRSSAVFVDGKITYPGEWKDAKSYRIYLRPFEEGRGCSGNYNVSTTWLVKNDRRNLYVLVGVSKVFLIPMGASLSYFYPYPFTEEGWQKSDTMSVDQGKPLDEFGWNGVKFRDDISDGGSMDTRAKSSRSDQYYWFELSKPLHSGDSHDWSWKPGAKVGTAVTGDLLIGTWGNRSGETGVDFVCRYIQMQLANNAQK